MAFIHLSDESRASPILLSSVRATAGQRRTALAVSVLLLFMLLATASFAWVHWVRLPAFVPVQKTLMLVADLITAALLFGQYSIERTRKLNILASGYLFTALITIPHMLTFPGVFAEDGLLGAGTQSAAWLFIAWHGGLPLAAIAFALERNPKIAAITPIDRVGISVWMGALSAIGAVAAVTLIVTTGHEYLPSLIEGGRYTTTAHIVVGGLLLLPLSALLLLIRRPSLLELWLMVVMFAWFCTITVGAFLSSGRYDVGWYMGLIFDSLTSLFVLLILLHETIALYARQFRAAEIERRERERRLNEMEAVLVHLSRVNELGQHVSTLIHEISQPLAAISMLAQASISMLAQASMRLAKGSTDQLKQTLEPLAEAAANAMAVVLHLRAFIKNNQPDRRIQQIPEIVEDAIGMASLGDVSELVIDTRYQPAATSAFCDRVQIEQVVFNLVHNAVEAMAGNAPCVLTVASELTPEGLIQISIADNGPGLPSTVRAKLFEPFITTKSSGLGVGLSICRVIIEAHGGRLWAEDNPGGGTIFRFTLPQEPADITDEEKQPQA
jgi:signal transduction histidine kinase